MGNSALIFKGAILLSPTSDKVSSLGSCIDSMLEIIASDPPVIIVVGLSIVASVGSSLACERHWASSKSLADVHCSSSVSTASIEDSM